MVPKHEILSEDAVKSLLEMLRITRKELPKILESDVIVKELNAKENDVIQITRNSSLVGKSIYYRVVLKEQ